MRAFFTTILLYCSVILSAQINYEINTRLLLADNGISNTSIDAVFYNNNSHVEIDSIQQKSLNYKSWYKFSLFELGYGGSSMKLDSMNNKILYGGYTKTSVGSFEIGFNSLNGLGFGTKIGEFFNIQNDIGINSYFPLYTYYPIYISKKTKPGREGKFNKIPSMINLYAGGSLWCSTSDTFRYYKDIILASKYCHIGLDYMFYNYTIDAGFLGNGNFSLDAGMIFYESKDTNLKNVFYVGLIWAFGGWVIKPL
ncbi:hypothetical protein ACSVH2_01075 [Flavobacterium sp. RSB2_4_14]|uniref:hypothetical protein n=1 Tax=Flavobacterium sp. RSB2_4_14 TaxID=3447665 RepID=UPI003F3A8BA7